MKTAAPFRSSLLTLIAVCFAVVAEASIRTDARFTGSSPATTNNDDSCDVMVAPAATLLLPYFEVDLQSNAGETTLFTVTNVTRLPQIAHVTLWTDWAYPLMSFDLFLSGYDVQAINLYDVIARGRIQTPDLPSDPADVGSRSANNDANPLLDIAGCANMPKVIPPALLQELQRALTTGNSSSCTTGRVGGTHANAIGYLTIDVNASCNSTLPTDPSYYATKILYDNVLTGDYEQVNSSQNFAQGGTMVHIRAIPEGGVPGSGSTNFSQTFYGRYLAQGNVSDRRQPLPSTFATRWITGGPTEFDTGLKIWLEGAKPSGEDDCTVAANGLMPVVEFVRFDEEENPTSFEACDVCSPALPIAVNLPATSRMSTDDGNLFPPRDEEVAGWMYLNVGARVSAFSDRPRQGWVISSMEAEGRYSADTDAAALGNGCSPATARTDEEGDAPVIAPAANTNKPLFATNSPYTVNNDDSCDITVAPAATLLLPYFEVDLASISGETTLFTVTNVTNLPQVARVTIWTDYGYPVLSFNIFLTGYDIQSLNLFDVISRGLIAPPGTTSDTAVGRRSADNDQNPLLDLTNCDNLATRVPSSLLNDVRSALTTGRNLACGNAPIGSAHAKAIGYVTIDVVGKCGPSIPTEPSYFASEILYDNVFLGDYQQVNSSQNFAQSNTMVHIRAIPEGGNSRDVPKSLDRTFYSRLQNGGTSDRRQPLPSTFAARWIDGGTGSFQTTFKVWREARTAGNAGCNVAANGSMPFVEIVAFDENQNPAEAVDCPILCIQPAIPAASRQELNTLNIPLPEGEVAGWVYMNLDNQHQESDTLNVASQNWVIVSMAAEGRYSVDYDATSLGNGCSPAVVRTDQEGGQPAIGPAPNTTPNP